MTPSHPISHSSRNGVSHVFNTKAEWVGGMKRGHRITRLSGYKHFDNGGFEPYFGGEEVEIDYGIWRLIMELNVRGFETLYCCSGLPEDHRCPERIVSGYVAFDGPIFNLLPFLPSGMAFEGGSMPCIRMQNSLGVMVRRAGWRTLLKQMQAHSSLYNHCPCG